MRAIACTMIGFVVFYIAGHTKKDAIMLRGAYSLTAHVFLALAIILMILGKQERQIMRDPNRIDKFCNELAAIWKSNAPDWRFVIFKDGAQ